MRAVTAKRSHSPYQIKSFVSTFCIAFIHHESQTSSSSPSSSALYTTAISSQTLLPASDEPALSRHPPRPRCHNGQLTIAWLLRVRLLRQPPPGPVLPPSPPLRISLHPSCGALSTTSIPRIPRASQPTSHDPHHARRLYIYHARPIADPRASS